MFYNATFCEYSISFLYFTGAISYIIPLEIIMTFSREQKLKFISDGIKLCKKVFVEFSI